MANLISGRRTHISLQPDVLSWARERSGLEVEELARKVGVKPARVEEWEKSGRISLSQIDKLAHHTHTPVGFLYLPEPVEDQLPISDFRTVGDRPLRRPSPELLDTVYMMQRRQAWMRDELTEEGNEPLSFVGAVDVTDEPKAVASDMRSQLGLGSSWADIQGTSAAALSRLRAHVEAVGVLVVLNGVVGNNTHRKLDPEEFRGFALVDEYAPLVFVNAADYKAAQLFTLVHELAHVWTGTEGVSNFAGPLIPLPHSVERFCNKVAAEFLVPEDELLAAWSVAQGREDQFEFLAVRFKVSPLVVARCALDLNLINWDSYLNFYRAWEGDSPRETGGSGNFWNNQNFRIGKRFATAVIQAVDEGRLLYRDAYSLTGLKGETFAEMVHRFGDDT